MSKNWVEIDDQSVPFSLQHFSIPAHYQDDLENILLPHGIILNRVEKLAQEIVHDYFNNDNNKEKKGGLVLICVLKGGHQFFADLLNFIKRINSSSSSSKSATSVPISLEFFKIKSYHNDSSTGSVTIDFTSSADTWSDICQRFAGRDLVIIEDIIDTGRTMTALLQKLGEIGAASVRVAALFLKRTPLSCGYVPDYVGFSIPDKFIVGYCLDYNEYFRDLDHVCVISESGKLKYKS